MKKTFRGFISAALFAVAVSALFQSWDIALVITLSLGFHELGHILVIQAMGIDWEFGFSYMGAWTRTPLKARQAIGHFANSLIHLAGPLFNFLLSVVAILLYFLGGPISRHYFWAKLANFSVLLGLTNLLPIGALSDGGKFLNRMARSLKHQSRARMVILVLQLFVVFSEHFRDFNDARTISIGIFALWFILGILINLRQQAAAPVEARPMTERQANALFSFLIMLILYSYLITVITPFWLNENDVLHIMSFYERSILAFNRLPTAVKWAALGLLLTGAGVLFGRQRIKDSTADKGEWKS